MRPILIEMQNFGPYQHEVVDFSFFSEVPLFLISGKTGAGKTTLFDAMCFALYGATSGGLRQGKEMRSNFADPATPTKVVFVFEHQDKKYRIERLPEQWLMKKRSSELKKQSAKVSLVQLDKDEQEEREWTKQKEVTQKIEDLLHLNVNQFCQIVLLPQGQFRRFLNANSNEREAVLRKLFQTEKYGQFADRIKEKKKQFEKELAVVQQSLDFMFERIHWEDALKEKVTDDGSIAEKLAFIEEQQKSYEHQLVVLQKELEQMEEEKQSVANILREKQQLLDCYRDLEQLKKQKQALEESAEDINEIQQEIEQLRYLQGIKKDWDFYLDSEKEYAELQTECQVLAEELTKSLQKQERLAVQKAQLEEEAESFERKKQEVQKLKQILPLFQESHEKEQFAAESEKEIMMLSEQQMDSERQQKSLLKQLEPLEKQIEQLPMTRIEQQKLTQQINQRMLAVESLESWLESVRIYQGKKSELESLQQQISQLTEQELEQQKSLARAKHEFAKAQILYLQQDLLEGEPCPVCGSLDHPLVHVKDDQTDVNVGELETAVAFAEQQLVEVREQLVRAKEKRIHLQKEITQSEQDWTKGSIKLAEQLGLERAKLSVSLDEAEDRLTTQQEKQAQWIEQQQQTLNHLQAAAQEAEKAQEKLIQLQENLHEWKQRSEQLISNIQTVKEQQLQVKAQITQLRKQADLVLKDVMAEDEVEQQVQLLEQAISSWEKLRAEAQQELSAINEKVTVRQAILKQKNNHLEKQQVRVKQLQHALLASLKKAPQQIDRDELENWFERLDELSELEENVRLYRLQWETVQQQEQQVLEKINQRDFPELTLEEEKLSVLEQRINKKIQEKSQLEQLYQQNKQVMKEISSTYEQQKEQQDQLIEWIELSNVANGDGKESHISLERYVLQTYLDEVLLVANNRLLKLSQHRYRFELKEDDAKYKTQAGLELDIFDENVGSARSVNTLSGGESFIAALSLSLALAEVIQMQSGGVQIDAMFIDEGFGSLDDESLEMAMEALESIEKNGRMIGIISHVKELKERIPYQLQVISDGAGKSRIQMITI